jgi:hypothetical protein
MDAKPQVKALAEMFDEDMLITASEKYGGYRKFVPAFLETLEFKAASPKNRVLRLEVRHNYIRHVKISTIVLGRAPDGATSGFVPTAPARAECAAAN